MAFYTTGKNDEEAAGLADCSVSTSSLRRRGAKIASSGVVSCMGISLILSCLLFLWREAGIRSSEALDLAPSAASARITSRKLKQAPSKLCTNDCDNAPDFVAGIRASIPLPHDTINGKLPPGIPSGARSDIVSSEWHERELFVVYAISGRQPGYRTPIHVHPRPQTVCLLEGTVLNIVEGRNDTMYSAGDCYVMPALTKMVNYNIGNVSYKDHDIFRVPAGETDWVVIEPGSLDLQGDEFNQTHVVTGRQVNVGVDLIMASEGSRRSQAKDISLNGLHQYFASVSAIGIGKDDKLDGIVQRFTANAVLVRPDGARLVGHEGVKEFYSKESPALKLDDFKLLVNSNTMSFSQDGRTIAVEILMPLPGNTTSPISVFFTFDHLGKIAFKRIYAWPQP